MSYLRNFCIIAHIDHGKSTLADRFLEITGTIDKRKMQAQYLDQMDLERERGITIKMAPVRMVYHLQIRNPKSENRNKLEIQNSKLSAIDEKIANSKQEFILNLIDTPGHSDFSYEVSRALAAVEGAILLVDATQGIQAQTLSNFRAAEKAGLKLIGAVNKIDMNPPNLENVLNDLASLLNCDTSEIHRISGKTGFGVEKLLEAVIEKIPSPTSQGLEFGHLKNVSEAERARFRAKRGERGRESSGDFLAGEINHGFSNAQIPARSLIFDSFYDNHKGIVASVRVFGGEFSKEEAVTLIATDTSFKIKELGFFSPSLKPQDKLMAGEIGYIATGIKNPEKVKIGDTIIQNWKLPVRQSLGVGGKIENSEALTGYKEPRPVVFVSVYPEDADEYDSLKIALQKLKLNDSSLTIDPDQNEVLGRGFRVGFLGRLHFEIVAERLEREFDVSIVTTFPSVSYRVKANAGWVDLVNPEDLPQSFLEIWEPMVEIEIIMPIEYLNSFFAIQQKFRLDDIETETAHDRAIVKAKMPLAELMSDFDDHLKSMSRGYASFSYELGEYQKADVVKVDFMVAGEAIAGLSRFFHKSIFDKEARKMLERLKELLPQQQFAQSLQAVAMGKIIAREDILAMRKDVTGHLYGGDRTRKMKLWKKQKRGKEKLKERADVKISPSIFKELLKK